MCVVLGARPSEQFSAAQLSYINRLRHSEMAVVREVAEQILGTPPFDKCVIKLIHEAEKREKEEMERREKEEREKSRNAGNGSNGGGNGRK